MNRYRYLAPQGIRRALSGRYSINQPDSFGSVEEKPIGTPSHGTYGGLLFDPRWKTKRAEILKRDSDCCIICKSIDELQVHHRQYQYIKQVNAFRMPWDYPSHLLITLCKSCHNRGHAKFKVPTLIIQ